MNDAKPPIPVMHWVKIVLLTPLLLAVFLGALVALCIGGADHRFPLALAGGTVLMAGLEWFTFIIRRGHRQKGAATPVAGIVLLHLLVGGLVVFFVWKSLFGN